MIVPPAVVEYETLICSGFPAARFRLSPVNVFWTPTLPFLSDNVPTGSIAAGSSAVVHRIRDGRTGGDSAIAEYRHHRRPRGLWDWRNSRETNAMPSAYWCR